MNSMIKTALALAIVSVLGCGDKPASETPEADTAPEADKVATDVATTTSDEDKFLWLEEVEGEKALAWVKEKNASTLKEIEAMGEYQSVKADALEILNAKDRVQWPSRRGDYLYNFWRDETHVKGIYRRTTTESYLTGEPVWETVLDIDALSEADGESWVYKGMSCLYPDYLNCSVSLSPGGTDAVITREFSLEALDFVEGFELPLAKGGYSFIDPDTVFVSTDFGEGSLTESGYPRIVKKWRRGESLEEAKTVFETDVTSISATGYTMFDGDARYEMIREGTTFFTSNTYVLQQDKPVKLDIPEGARLRALFKGQLLVQMRGDWKPADKEFVKGSLIVANFEELIAGNATWQVLFEPSENSSLASVSTTRDYLFLNTNHDVSSRVERYELGAEGFVSTPLNLGDNGAISILNTSDKDNEFYATFTNFVTPTQMYMGDAATLETQLVRESPSRFDSEGMQVEQHFATSKDGTKVPYYVVKPKGYEANGKNPTLLYGYGGFEISLRPSYSAMRGKEWVERGGVYVLANIRGGGEYGPRWHQAALKKNRMKAYEDFIAIAEDLIAQGVTAPDHLGIQGGSNGGLLVGAVTMLRPDLFDAVVCQVPLLDMKRYHKLLAGASWVGEYGNPDNPEMWSVIKTYSPYQNIQEGVEYPEIFFTTSTKDDRVHPGHARKMVAKMESMGHKVFYYENMEGGHAGAADNNQRADVYARVYAYLWHKLK